MRCLVPAGFLLLTAAAAAQDPDPVVPDFATLSRQFEAAQKQWNADVLAARERKDQARQAELRKSLPEQAFVAPMQRGAALHAGSPAAVPFLDWLAFHGRTPAVTRPAVEALLHDHIDTPEAGRAASRVVNLQREFGRSKALELLDRIIAHQSDGPGLAQALFSRSGFFLGTRGSGSEAERGRALADLHRARSMQKNASLGGLIDDAIYGEEVLGIGRPAPEIEGEDLDGVPFKLSDYRGKVVLLDFWGDW
jgi:hypothetical protein